MGGTRVRTELTRCGELRVVERVIPRRSFGRSDESRAVDPVRVLLTRRAGGF